METSELNELFGKRLGDPEQAAERIKYEGRRLIKKGSWTAFLADDVAYSAMLSPDPTIPQLMICEIEREDEENISFAVAPHDLDNGTLDIRNQMKHILNMAPYMAPQFIGQTREPV